MSKPSEPRSRLVYATGAGRICPDCGKPVAACACRQRRAAPTASGPNDGTARVLRETKGRGGKAVTVVRGLASTLDDKALAELAKRLRAACGSGGTVKDGVIEVQGDHCERVMALLAGEGLRAKRAGG